MNERRKANEKNTSYFACVVYLSIAVNHVTDVDDEPPPCGRVPGFAVWAWNASGDDDDAMPPAGPMVNRVAGLGLVAPAYEPLGVIMP